MPPFLALTIAGSDCSAGAGIQADLKTFTSFGLHGLTALTCVVSETPLTVSKIHPVPPNILQDQIRLLLESYPIAAVKTGMLYSKAHIIATCELLADYDLPLVVDPVMVASTGTPLLLDDALAAVSKHLLPLATVITPNLPEAELLLGREVTTHHEQEAAAHDLADKFDNACYLKGGHFEDCDEHRDLIVAHGQAHNFTAPHLAVTQSHGTGCTLSAALTAGLACGLELTEAAHRAHYFTHQALMQSVTWDRRNSTPAISHLNQNPLGPANS